MKIAILGAGHIGSDLATLWAKKNYQVTIVSRQPERFNNLIKTAQKCIVFKGNDENELISLIQNNETILITVSLDFPDEFEDTFLQTAHAFRKVANNKVPPRNLIYMSSTAIYGDHRGLWVDETSKLKTKSEQGKALIEAERIFLSLEDFDWHVCILRVAEIYGPFRELSDRLRSFQGQILPGSGKSFSNMVHCSDVTSAVDYALKHRLEGIFNIADDDHPTRQELYDRISSKHGLPMIQWDNKTSGWKAGNKRISNYKIKTKGFAFQFPKRVID